MLRFGKITVSAGFGAMLLLSLLFGAAQVLPYVALAAMLHELGHLTALSQFGVRVEEIAFTAFGVEIRADTRFLSYRREVFCVLAGPLVNIAAAFLLARLSGEYVLAGANILQGCFNLLPLTGLDGGRALHLILCLLLDPVRADRVSYAVELSFLLMLTGIVLYLLMRYRTGEYLLIAMIGVFTGVWRKIRGK